MDVSAPPNGKHLSAPQTSLLVCSQFQICQVCSKRIFFSSLQLFFKFPSMFPWKILDRFMLPADQGIKGGGHSPRIEKTGQTELVVRVRGGVGVILVAGRQTLPRHPLLLLDWMLRTQRCRQVYMSSRAAFAFGLVWDRWYLCLWFGEMNPRRPWP